VLRAGDVLDRYVLLDRLASGGMGDVYLASKAGPLGLGPWVALKLLREEVQADPDFIEMLADEAKISMFLDHQNIVSVLDFAEVDGAHFLVMEFVRGTTAQALVDAAHGQGTRLPPPVAVFVATQVARALRHAHDRVDHRGRPLHIVHRDVTPANILLSAEGDVKLTDFGIARARNRMHRTQAGVVKGKFGYLPPEAVRAQQMDRRADLFCAGVSLYLLLTGRHPAADKTAFEAVEMYERREVQPPSVLVPGLPSVLDEAIMRALEPDPGRRWPDAASWEQALRDGLSALPDSRRSGNASALQAVITQLLPAASRSPVSEAQLTAACERAKPRLDPSYGAGTAPTIAPRRVDPLGGSDDLELEPDDFPPSVMDRPTDASLAHRAAHTSVDHEPFLPADEEEEGEAPPDDQTLADGPPLEDDQTWLGSLPPDDAAEDAFTDRTLAGVVMPADRDTQPSESSMPAVAPAPSEPTSAHSSPFGAVPAPSASSEVVPARSAPTLEPDTPPGPPLVAPRAPAPYFEDEVPAPPSHAPRVDPRRPSRSRPARERSRVGSGAGRSNPDPRSRERPSSASPQLGAGAPAPRARSASAAPLPSVPPLPSSVGGRTGQGGRHRRTLAIAGALVLLIGGAAFFALTSPVLWPRIELLSRPPGAVVTVNGQPRGRTPTTVRVAPGPGPRVEFRLTDHRPAARALVGTVRRGRTYRMSVELRPVPVLHVQPEATVSVDGRVVGTGTRVPLDALPEGAVEVRVEAPGFVPYQRRFASPAEVPTTWDVTLSKR